MAQEYIRRRVYSREDLLLLRFANINTQPNTVAKKIIRQPSVKGSEIERLLSREKQIRYGYNTVGYRNYIASVPRHERKPGMPITPNKNQHCAKRSWDAQIRYWRRYLHKFDILPKNELAHAEFIMAKMISWLLLDDTDNNTTPKKEEYNSENEGEGNEEDYY